MSSLTHYSELFYGYFHEMIHYSEFFYRELPRFVIGMLLKFSRRRKARKIKKIKLSVFVYPVGPRGIAGTGRKIVLGRLREIKLFLLVKPL